MHLGTVLGSRRLIFNIQIIVVLNSRDRELITLGIPTSRRSISKLHSILIYFGVCDHSTKLMTTVVDKKAHL